MYASSSRALACLETIVHLAGGDPLPLNRYLVEIEIPSAAWRNRVVFKMDSNVGWDAEPAGKVSLDWGTDWAIKTTSLIAVVPSVIVPEESNIIINPEHRDIKAIRARKICRWTYDGRLSAASKQVR